MKLLPTPRPYASWPPLGSAVLWALLAALGSCTPSVAGGPGAEAVVGGPGSAPRPTEAAGGVPTTREPHNGRRVAGAPQASAAADGHLSGRRDGGAGRGKNLPDSDGLPTASPTAPAGVPAPVTSPPAYDLEADLAARKGEALAELGARTGTAVSHGVFLLVAPKRTLQSTLPLLTQVFDAYFNQRFLREPRRAISVYLFPSARTYSAYCRARWQTECTSIYGFYLGSERRIVMNIELGVGTLTHELVHPIMQTDFPESPMWFEEGVASLYERFGLLKRGEIRGYTNWRLNGLRQGLKHNPNHASLTHLFGLSDVEFRDDEESLHYAAARYFCQWLEEQGKLWPFYRKWQSSAGDDPTGQRSFESVMGMTPAEANGVWIRWVNQL